MQNGKTQSKKTSKFVFCVCIHNVQSGDLDHEHVMCVFGVNMM